MMDRVGQIAWTLYHLDDLDADFLRFYRREWWDMPGPAFFSRAYRVGAYGGVISAIAAEEREPGPVAEPGTEVEVVAPTRAAITADPAFAGLIEWEES